MKKNDLKLKKKLTRSFVEYKKEEEKEWKGTKENIFQRFVFSFVWNKMKTISSSETFRSNTISYPCIFGYHLGDNLHGITNKNAYNQKISFLNKKIKEIENKIKMEKKITHTNMCTLETARTGCHQWMPRK